MKPILFEKDATVFTSFGLARLPDAESCIVTEERNGAYELEMTYPVSGRFFSEIQPDRILVAIPHDGGGKQAFRIYATDTTIDGRVVFYARHISYQLNYIPIPAMDGRASGAAGMMGSMAAQALANCPFSFASDITGERDYTFKSPVGLRSALGGMEGSVLDSYGGEFEWDNWTVRLHAARGADNGVRITYGKNLTDLAASEDIGSTITGVAPFWQKQGDDGAMTTVYSSPRVITISNNYAHERIVPLDVSKQFQEQPTAAQVTAYARTWLNNTEQTDPSASVEVDFVPIWQTEEYKQYAPLERVGLCDTVYVSYKQLGVTVKKKVTKTVWNVLLDRYDSIELGGASRITDTVASLSNGSDANANDIAALASRLDDLTTAKVITRQEYFGGTDTGIQSINARKRACAIDCYMRFNSSVPASGSTIGTIAEGYRPAHTVCVPIIGTAATAPCVGTMWIYASGGVSIYYSAAPGYADAVYLI